MNETTIETMNGMAHVAAPAETVAPLTIAQQLAAKLGELQSAQGSNPSDALASIAATVSAALAKHADLITERNELVLKAGAGVPEAVARRLAIRGELLMLTEEMEEQIVDVSAYLQAHAADVSDRQRGELEGHAAGVVSLGDPAVDAWRAVDAAGAAFHDALRRAVAVGTERAAHAAPVIGARHGDDPIKCMDAQMVNSPRCLGVHGGTIATFGKFVQQAVDIIGRDHRVEGALRERDLAYRAGVESFEHHARHDAAQLAKDFSSAFPEPPQRVDAVLGHDQGYVQASYTSANGVAIDEAAALAAQRWAVSQVGVGVAGGPVDRPGRGDAE